MNIRTLGLALTATALVGGCGEEPANAPVAPPADALPPAEAAGVTSKDFGDYVVHFNALTTDQLTPEIAKSYGIVRSSNRALLNISVLKKVAGTTGQPVAATVTALVANDTGQVKDSTVREIREADAVYYIADYAVSGGETLVFTVDVIPHGETTALGLRFSRTFYGK